MGGVGGAVINPASFERWVPRTEAARRRLAANPPVAITGLPLFPASHYAEPSAEAILAASQTPSAISAHLARSERAELALRLLCGHAHTPCTGSAQGQSFDSAVHSLADSAFIFGTPPVPTMSQPPSLSQPPIAQRARSIIVKRQRAQHAQHAQRPVHCQASTQAPTQASTHVESTQSLVQRAQRADFCGQASTDGLDSPPEHNPERTMRSIHTQWPEQRPNMPRRKPHRRTAALRPPRGRRERPPDWVASPVFSCASYDGAGPPTPQKPPTPLYAAVVKRAQQKRRVPPVLVDAIACAPRDVVALPCGHAFHFGCILQVRFPVEPFLRLTRNIT